VKEGALSIVRSETKAAPAPPTETEAQTPESPESPDTAEEITANPVIVPVGEGGA